MSAFTEYFVNRQANGETAATLPEIHSCPELTACIREVGFLPLLESGIHGYSAEGLMAEECRFTRFDDGSWEWPLWQWKGSAIREEACVYGKFFNGKAGFVSREWWPDFCNWRRSITPPPQEGTIEEMILDTLRENEHMITRELRAACGFTGKNMRSKFDAFVSRLQMGTHMVTEDFVYPTDKHGREYGFGWALLTTPERLLGETACRCERTPAASYQRMVAHMTALLPEATEKQIKRLL